MTDIQIITNTKELEGTCYIEVLPGKYQNKCWNDGSLYFSEETFGYLEPIIEKHVPKYDHYSFTEITREKWFTIIDDLDELTKKLTLAKSFKEIQELVGFIFLGTSEDFEISFEENKEALSKAITDFVSWLRQILVNNDRITILGI